MKHLKMILAAVCCVMVTMAYAVCSPVNVTYLTSGLGDCTTDNSAIWTWDSYNYAKGTAFKQGLTPSEAHLFTPALDLSGSEKVTLGFAHAHNYCGNPEEELTLWVTDNYKGSYAASTWHQLTINPYSNNSSWTWVDATVSVPVSYVGSNTVFAFKYKWTASNTGTWEVKKLRIVSECAGGEIGSPVPLPEIGDGRLRIFTQNVRNYYFHYDNYESDRANYDHAAFAKKTRQMVDVMLMTKADIFAFCEVEAQPEVLAQLADSMNQRVEGELYVSVADGIDVPWDSYDNNMKSGFIYRKDKVKPYGPNDAAATAQYYKNTQRIQAFEELATKERFTIAMNHFKAKDNTDDQGNATRVMNANNLVNALKWYAVDPDILILGDFNCQKGEEPITIIENAGYTEQILKYESDAYSHCYLSSPELIDHVFANASMEQYITGAGIFHICTNCGDGYNNAAYRYSDHDVYLVALNLPEKQETGCEDLNVTLVPKGGSGLSPMFASSLSGTYSWTYDASYGATCQDRGGEDWLITPTYDLSQSTNIQLSFEHALNFANGDDKTSEQTLWVTPDFSTIAGSQWTQLTIPSYPAGTNWTYVTANISVPENLVGENTAFAFKYKVPAEAANKPKWEIRNLNIKATCLGTGTGLIENKPMPRAQKSIENGQLLITLPDGTRYNGFGIRIR